MNELYQLKRAVQALAQPAHVQPELFPDFVVVGDELGLDFEEALRLYMPECGQELSPGQRAALEALDSELERLSGPANEDFWLDPSSLAKDPRWGGIRLLAKAVLREMDWPDSRPGPSDAIYVPG